VPRKGPPARRRFRRVNRTLNAGVDFVGNVFNNSGEELVVSGFAPFALSADSSFSSIIIGVFCPVQSHTRTVSSEEPLTNKLLSALKSSDQIGFL